MKLYTIILNEHQLQMLMMALERFSLMWFGQTGLQYEAFKQLFKQFDGIKPGTTDLTK